ncbi:receptor activity-modifying protein 2-like isoform X2 [Hypanus sabinus]|uniref:receptor activity-modifying protein 2-like isoform X2 n=1 Tax=Hypanus sabinus TaxID=79690 RepID=UPI0028C4AD24|nr:receptor activity-modifying protein 2-like isoform X2 [Hypanus sabinus]XP_059818681.1 receptor activity-modifying protein 2-like isoform X2 [Hypanus sabinus]
MLTRACFLLTLASLSAGGGNETLLQQNGTGMSNSDLDPSFFTGSLELQLLFATRKWCRNAFDEKMRQIGPQQWCNWTAVARPYSDLTHCTERLLEHIGLYWPNEFGESMFVEVHHYFFHSCLREFAPLLSDPPYVTVLGLTLAPIGIIPIIVTLVVWCSKINESHVKK